MMNKRVKAQITKFHKENYRIKFCLGTIALICVCVALIVMATFTQIKINFNIPENTLGTYMKFEYIPQIPVIIFTAALLGESWGLMSVIIYIIMGLTPFYPIFALGGGMSYVFQYNFGYIFAYIFAVLLVAKLLKGKPSVRSMIKAVLGGVLIIHVIGIVYMMLISLLRHDSMDFVKNWIYYQSASKIIYDIVFSFIALVIARGIRRVLWLLMG
ncbi:biotin transporter BioY [bacterium]|nr:biotin transporter BioY [bacterium]